MNVKQSELSNKVYAKDYTGWILWENHGKRDGFFPSLTTLYEYCSNQEISIPQTVIACEPRKLRLDANSIIEWALDEHHEDAGEQISKAERNELQILLNAWCAKTTMVSYFPTTTEVVLWEEIDGQIVDMTR